MSDEEQEAPVQLNRYYNTTDGPIRVNEEGRILGGFEHDNLPITEQTQKAVAEGSFIDKGSVEVEEVKELKVPVPYIEPDDEQPAQPEHPAHENGSAHSNAEDAKKDDSEPDKSNKSANKGRNSGKVK